MVFKSQDFLFIFAIPCRHVDTIFQVNLRNNKILIAFGNNLRRLRFLVTTRKKSQCCMLIKYYFLRGKTIKETKEKLGKYCGNSVSFAWNGS